MTRIRRNNIIKQTLLRLDEDIHSQLKVLAAEQKTTMSKLADKAIREYIERTKNDK